MALESTSVVATVSSIHSLCASPLPVIAATVTDIPSDVTSGVEIADTFKSPTSKLPTLDMLALVDPDRNASEIKTPTAPIPRSADPPNT